MAVEYIDSPNAGFIKLGEGVGLETITPQRKRKIKRGDRGVFPITPTGAESYEETDFTAQQGFTTPASAIPNVFDRYKDLPGGARAGGFPGGSFEDVISPGIGNQNDDANDDDEDLEEELRRQSLDIDPVGDYDLSRFDPNSPNFNPTAAGEQAYADVLTGGDFFSSLDRFGVDQFSGEAATISFSALGKANSDIERAQNLVNKTTAGTRIGDFALNALESATQAQKNLQIVNDVIGKRGAAPSGDIPTTVPEQQKDFRGLTANQARFFSGQNVLGGTGVAKASTEIPKVSIGSSAPAGAIPSELLDLGFGVGSAPTGVPIFSGSVGRSGMFGLPDVRSDIGETPTPTGFSQDAANAAAAQANLDSIDIPSGVDIDIPGGGGSFSVDADAVTVETPDGFVESFGAKDGGKISFMNIKK